MKTTSEIIKSEVVVSCLILRDKSSREEFSLLVGAFVFRFRSLQVLSFFFLSLRVSRCILVRPVVVSF
jgi:hypothetical protein